MQHRPAVEHPVVQRPLLADEPLGPGAGRGDDLEDVRSRRRHDRDDALRVRERRGCPRSPWSGAGPAAAPSREGRWERRRGAAPTRRPIASLTLRVSRSSLSGLARVGSATPEGDSLRARFGHGYTSAEACHFSDSDYITHRAHDGRCLTLELQLPMLHSDIRLYDSVQGASRRRPFHSSRRQPRGLHHTQEVRDEPNRPAREAAVHPRLLPPRCSGAIPRTLILYEELGVAQAIGRRHPTGGVSRFATSSRCARSRVCAASIR